MVDDDPPLGEQFLYVPVGQAVVGSDQGAVSAFRLARFPGPPTEPDVRLSPHPALHCLLPSTYAAVPVVVVAHGVGITAPR
jgi:hypothetical protein